MKDEDKQMKKMEGIAVIVLSVIFLAVAIFVPARQGASPGSKFGLAASGCVLLSWGVRRVKSVTKSKKHTDDIDKTDDHDA
jgi:hypothetical protein